MADMGVPRPTVFDWPMARMMSDGICRSDGIAAVIVEHGINVTGVWECTDDRRGSNTDSTLKGVMFA